VRRIGHRAGAVFAPVPGLTVAEAAAAGATPLAAVEACPHVHLHTPSMQGDKSVYDVASMAPAAVTLRCPKATLLGAGTAHGFGRSTAKGADVCDIASVTTTCPRWVSALLL
jgi:hypothetical protein